MPFSKIPLLWSSNFIIDDIQLEQTTFSAENDLSYAMATPTTFHFVNLPPKTFVGVDLLSFDSSPNFRGISNVPHGIHLVYTGSDASLALRNGRWISISSSRAQFIFSWNSADECLELLSPSQALQRVTPLDTLAQGLIDYSTLHDATSSVLTRQNAQDGHSQQVHSLDAWPTLTTYVSPSVLDRILGSTKWEVTSTSSTEVDIEHIPGLSQTESATILDAEITLIFTPINLKQTWPDGAVGSERTDKARDRSWYLSNLIDSLGTSSGGGGGRRDGAKHLLGELQVCFLMVLTLANYSCLEQWKRILSVVLTCRTALKEVEGYFVQVLGVLRLQMEHVEDVDGGLFDLEDQENSAWLRRLFRGFGQILGQEVDRESRLGEAWKEIESLMQEKYGWVAEGDVLRRGMLDLEDGERVEVSLAGMDEEEEEGEYAPVVVEM